jgi:hypothetical protein
MTTSQPGLELLRALRRLQTVARDLRQTVEQSPTSGKTPLERLQATVSALGHAPARPLQCPTVYVQHWQEVLAGTRAALTLRAIRHLCWEPEVALSPPFQDYLETLPEGLHAQALQGLVHSCQARWSPELAASPVVSKVRRRLESYQGTHAVLCRWREAATMMLGPLGHKAFAARMVAQRQAIGPYCAVWAVDEQSPYVLEAVRQAVQNCLDGMGHDATLYQYFLTELLPWPGWPL